MNQGSTPLPPEGPRTSTNAIISLIGGIAGWTLLPFIGSLLGVIFGHIAKKEIKNSKSITMKNGKPATPGVCPTCGTKMFRIGKG